MSKHLDGFSRALATLAILRAFIKLRGHSPTQWELADLHGMTDVGVMKRLRHLQARGYVTIAPRRWRGVTVTEKGWNAGVQP